MKKQSDMHGPNRVPENESVITNPSNPAYSSSKPKGLEDHQHPGHLSRGAAESHTPVHEEEPVSHDRGKKHP
jgi:hypothetical protein